MNTAARATDASEMTVLAAAVVAVLIEAVVATVVTREWACCTTLTATAVSEKSQQ